MTLTLPVARPGRAGVPCSSADASGSAPWCTGGYHEAWCWERLLPELQQRGHRTTTVDLPITDPAAGATEYAEAIREAAQNLDEVILVGNSMG